MDVSLGDKVRLMVTNASQFTPLGRIPSQRIFTVAGIYNTGSDVDGQLMLTHIDDAARLLRFKQNTITGWRLFFDDPFVVAELSKQPLSEGWQWQDWRDQRGELFQAVRMEKYDGLDVRINYWRCRLQHYFRFDYGRDGKTV